MLIGLKMAVWVVAIGVGYLVLARAKALDGWMRKFGQVLGWALMVGAVCSLGCLAYWACKWRCGSSLACCPAPATQSTTQPSGK